MNIVADEKAVLGAAMRSESSAALVAERLAADDFREQAHATVFLALANMRAEGRSGERELLDQLARDGQLEAVGGASFLHTLYSAAPSGANRLEDTVRRVENAARRRRIYRAGEAICEAAKDPTVAEDELTGIAVDALVESHVGYESQAGIIRPRETFTKLEALYEGKRDHEPLTVGWKTLDEFYMPAKSRWTVVTGIPSHGKSTLMDAVAVNMARLHGWRWCVCSPENQPLEEHEAQILSTWAGRPFHPGPTQRLSRDMLESGKKWLDEHFTFLLPDDRGRNIDTVIALARVEHQLRPFDGLIIDPWNELDHSRPEGMAGYEYISRCLTRVRSFARQLQVHVWIVAHPTKMRKEDDGTYSVPTPYDIKGAGEWRDKADNVLAVWRDPGKPEDGTEVHVQKVRFQRQGEGTEGMVRLQFDKPSGRFYEKGGPV